MRKFLPILLILVLIFPFFSDSVDAEIIDVEGRNGVWLFLEGKEQDEFKITLRDASLPIDIWILSQSNYQKYFTDQDFKIEWKVENVTKGEWIWEMKSNDQWIFLINNPNNVNVDVDYTINNKSGTLILKGVNNIRILCIALIIIFIIIIITLSGLALILYMGRKKKKENLNHPKFRLVEDRK